MDTYKKNLKKKKGNPPCGHLCNNKCDKDSNIRRNHHLNFLFTKQY